MADRAENTGGTTLIQRLAGQESRAEAGDLIPEDDNSGIRTERLQKTADGYMRRTPVQRICVSRGYRKRKIALALRICAVLVFLGLLIAAIAVSGIVSFR